MLTILEGSTFCICDEIGDVGAELSGFFAEDTRFLSRLRLKVNGETPLPLSSGKVEYFSAAFYLRNPLAALGQDQVAITRERFVGEGMQDVVVLENLTGETLALELGLEFGADFADIFSVKEHDFALGDPLRASALPAPAPSRYDEEHNQFLIDDSEGSLRTQIILSRRGRVTDASIAFPVELAPRERWDLRIDLVAGSTDDVDVVPRALGRRFGEERSRVRDSLAAWQLRVPQLRADWEELSHSFGQSVSDLASLRMRGASGADLGKLPAAGMPWFMTVFGRDTIVTCLQTLLFGPELARSALDVLALLQADEDDPEIDAEPGKIVHEVRQGKAANKWFPRYYGSVDATPLYLILLSETWRWTDDLTIARDFRDPALRALEWIDRYGDRDGDGFVEFGKRGPRGLDVQSWKDSFDSQRFHDGTIAKLPIAPCEVQGYVYDAKLRIAELARDVWRDRSLADRLEREAADLRTRFDDAFWIDDERGGFYALGLDGEKRPIDSLCSNIGHLLWSGIVPPARVDAVVDQLMGEQLWSGWGVRTMSTEDDGYSPLSYHNGTVWPHDNSLIAWGLARYERWPEAHRIIQRMLGASRHFAYQLPEVFAGLRRADTPFPIAYPTAARPQAWAAGTPVLLLQLLLGLRPDRRRHLLESVAPSDLPHWTGNVRLTGVRAFERPWDVRLADGRVTVDAA